jgi:hypothetical protein
MAISELEADPQLRDKSGVCVGQGEKRGAAGGVWNGDGEGSDRWWQRPCAQNLAAADVGARVP